MNAFKTITTSVVMVLGLGGCYGENNPDVGTIEIFNDSDETIVILGGAPPRLELADAVGQGKMLYADPPGSRYLRQYHHLDEVDWCIAAPAVFWITRTDLDISPHGTLGPFDPDEFEILETIGPNICWGERHAEYHYTGD